MEEKYLDWLSHAIMVSKNSEKWQVDIDLTNLNNAFPKDHFSLHQIDQVGVLDIGHWSKLKYLLQW